MKCQPLRVCMFQLLRVLIQGAQFNIAHCFQKANMVVDLVNWGRDNVMLHSRTYKESVVQNHHFLRTHPFPTKAPTSSTTPNHTPFQIVTRLPKQSMKQNNLEVLKGVFIIRVLKVGQQISSGKTKNWRIEKRFWTKTFAPKNQFTAWNGLPVEQPNCKENFLFIFKLLTATRRCLELLWNKNFKSHEMRMRFRNHIKFYKKTYMEWRSIGSSYFSGGKRSFRTRLHNFDSLPINLQNSSLKTTQSGNLYYQ